MRPTTLPAGSPPSAHWQSTSSAKHDPRFAKEMRYRVRNRAPARRLHQNMRYLLVTAAALLALAPAVVNAQASWEKATATSVSAGVHSNSTFRIQAMVTLPNQCYTTRIVSSPLSERLHRHFTVVEMAPSSACTK